MSDDVLDALAERMRAAAALLDEMASACERPAAYHFSTKAEGVRLALSYVRDAKRGVS